jgi:hypothetical protein
MAGKSKKPVQKAVKNYIELLYMTPQEIRAKDIAQILQGTPGFTAQLWEEMNILELELPNQDSVDFEPVETAFKDPSDAAFIKNRNIETIFAINLCEADLNTVIAIFENIVGQFSGFLCADSEDFTPVYVGSSKK